MTITEYNRLKWGSILTPSKRMYEQFPRSDCRQGIYLGKTKDGEVKVIMKFHKNPQVWNRLYWLPTTENAL